MVGRIVAGVGVAQLSGGQIQRTVKSGDEHRRRVVLAQQSVGLLQTGAGFRHDLGDGADDGAGDSHEQRGGDPLVRNVRDHQSQPAVGQIEKIVKITADFTHGVQFRAQVEFPALGKAFRQQSALDAGRDVQFLSQRRQLNPRLLGLAKLLGGAGQPADFIDAGWGGGEHRQPGVAPGQPVQDADHIVERPESVAQIPVQSAQKQSQRHTDSAMGKRVGQQIAPKLMGDVIDRGQDRGLAVEQIPQR